ncbi:TerB family tellurite resistance protein [Pelagibacterales bacterium SAG-MED31]|nr:TerB family tellurite resistance protein [Pelagibacterales bacterium SAG-MED31]
MLQSLKNIFSNNNNQNQSNDNHNDIDILAGLLIEAANTDGKVSPDEVNKISLSLINIFKENPKDVDIALSRAIDDKDNSHSLFFYTSKLNKSFSPEKKILLIEVLWEVILSDNEIHDFESNLLRRLAGLLYVSDIECGKAKKRAENKVNKI